MEDLITTVVVAVVSSAADGWVNNSGNPGQPGGIGGGG